MNYFSDEPISLAAYRTIQATEAAPQMSRRYSFIPTMAAVGILRDHGWYPASAKEARTRKPDAVGFQNHALRFQNEALTRDLKIGTTIPQISLRNSHAGQSAFILDLALLELRCTNGLMADLGGKEQMRILHRNFNASEFEQALHDLCLNFDDIMTTVDRWRSIQINEAQARAYADDAIRMRWDGEKYSVDRDELLLPTRHEERERTLWNTFNVVQEKLLKGGVETRQTTGKQRMRKARSITNIRLDAKLNKQLWQLTTKLEASL